VLHLHRSERADALVEALADVLSTDAVDVFAPDVVAVPARGVERWLTQRLSHRLGAGVDGASDGGSDGGSDGVSDGAGVCANVVFPWPSRLVADAIAAGSGVDPAADPWRAGRALWSVLDVIDASATEAWLAPLGRHLGQGHGRRFIAARHLTDLFDAYAAHRPAMLGDWVRGVDSDGLGGPIPADLSWQPELWRRLRQRIGVPSPAERLDAACAALRADPSCSGLPGRVSLFGPTRLTTDQVAVLAALAEHRDVHLWLPHPSAELWNAVAEVGGERPLRRDDPTAGAASHPLLSSLGRDAREMQLVLSTTEAAVSHAYHPLTEPPDTLLGRLQDALRSNTSPPGVPLGEAADRRALLAAGDRSLQVHACHGRARQVEVLREVLLGLLAADATLEPRDVLVMCPDIEIYAPLISATFGLGSTEDVDPAQHPGHRLRVRLADRSLRQTNPVLATLARVLELADARVTASQVLDLAALPPVRRRFRFDDESLERLREWVAASGTRWGLDAAHRAPYRLECLGQNTWAAGLDRLLLGAAMSEDDLRWVGLALPLDDVDSGDIDLAGRLAELVDRLTATLDSLRDDQSLTDWLAALSGALDSLTTVSTADAWQLSQARRQLDEVAETAGDEPVALSLADVRALLADRLQGRPTRAGFRTGNLTVCSMVPMRSVPHRVICLLGLDDGAFPRSTGIDGDDVLARDPRVGERDRRSEDRQLLLDAILAATEHLVVLYTGADERTNVTRPAAVPVGEILDVVDATVRTADGSRARDQVVCRHPLQPFDARNFTAGALGADGPFSFDRASLAGARAAAQPRHPHKPFLSGPVPMPDRTDAADQVELDDLLYFLEHPVRGFLRRRLNILVAEEGDELDEALAVDLEGLRQWNVGDRWLTSRLAGHDPERCGAAEWRRGVLPPGAIGVRALAAVEQSAEPLVAATAQVRTDRRPTSHDISVTLPSGTALTGTVGDVHGHRLVRSVYSRLGPKHRVRAWAQLLALAAAEPDTSWQATTLGRPPRGTGVCRSTMGGLSGHQATTVLGELVDLYRRGLAEPLPLPVATSCEYARLRLRGTTEARALEAARVKWDGDYGDGRDRYHLRVWGERAALERLLESPPPPAELADGSTETSRFGALACRLWFPMLGAEAVDRP
jgi:exodeoxyribonuclease V gamma subunit